MLLELCHIKNAELERTGINRFTYFANFCLAGVFFDLAVNLTALFNTIHKTCNQVAVVQVEHPAFIFLLQQSFNLNHRVSFFLCQFGQAWILAQLSQCLAGSFGDTHDVNTPTSQFGCQARVLSFTSDGEAELILRHHHHGGFIITFAVVQVYTRNPGRAEGFADIDSRVRIPLDDVDFFVMQLTHDCLDTDTPLPDTSANRVNALLSSRNCYFGTLTRLTGNRTDLDNAMVDLRNFILQ